MSLTLFPITALLLLLSGVGAPAHAAGCMETLAALRGQFYGRVTDSIRVAARQGRNRTSGLARSVAMTATEGARQGAVVAGAIRGQGPLRLWARKQYHTRFGFAEGAYLAVGPPLHGPLVLPG